jgi:hypothetical protein
MSVSGYTEKADAAATAVAGAAKGVLMDIGTVAAHNIALALEMGEKEVPVIRQAIRDEISAMSSHFTFAIADVQTQYEVELAKIKSVFTYIEANVWRVVGVMAGMFALGVIVGHVV